MTTVQEALGLDEKTVNALTEKLLEVIGEFVTNAGGISKAEVAYALGNAIAISVTHMGPAIAGDEPNDQCITRGVAVAQYAASGHMGHTGTQAIALIGLSALFEDVAEIAFPREIAKEDLS